MLKGRIVPNIHILKVIMYITINMIMATIRTPLNNRAGPECCLEPFVRILSTANAVVKKKTEQPPKKKLKKKSMKRAH
jgi:hypothetical protein